MLLSIHLSKFKSLTIHVNIGLFFFFSLTYQILWYKKWNRIFYLLFYFIVSLSLRLFNDFPQFLLTKSYLFKIGNILMFNKLEHKTEKALLFRETICLVLLIISFSAFLVFLFFYLLSLAGHAGELNWSLYVAITSFCIFLFFIYYLIFVLKEKKRRKEEGKWIKPLYQFNLNWSKIIPIALVIVIIALLVFFIGKYLF